MRILSLQKVERIAENVARTGFAACVTPEQSDAAVFRKDWETAFDLVIADLPCSGLGVLGRKPDIKLRLKEADIAALRELQRNFLCNAVRYLRPGGRLLYSTCTLTAEEDENNVRWLLDSFPGALATRFLCGAPRNRRRGGLPKGRGETSALTLAAGRLLYLSVSKGGIRCQMPWISVHSAKTN